MALAASGPTRSFSASETNSLRQRMQRDYDAMARQRLKQAVLGKRQRALAFARPPPARPPDRLYEGTERIEELVGTVFFPNFHIAPTRLHVQHRSTVTCMLVFGMLNISSRGRRTMFHNILVSIDGSPHADQALREAIDIALADNSRLTLLTSVRRAERPADPGHPFCYGQERFFWSLLAAFGIFVAGALSAMGAELLPPDRSIAEAVRDMS